MGTSLHLTGCLWVGWSGATLASEEATGTQPLQRQRMGETTLVTVDLTAEEVATTTRIQQHRLVARVSLPAGSREGLIYSCLQ